VAAGRRRDGRRVLPPAFAALTGRYGPGRVRALTALTLAAGFASTIFAPLTAILGGHLGWRTTYLVLAAILAAVTIPAHALTLRLPWDRPPRTRAATARRRGVLASRTFPAAGVIHDPQHVCPVRRHLQPDPSADGTGPVAADGSGALRLGGAGQVAGRLCYRTLAAHAGVRGRILAVTAAGALSTLLLALLPGPAALLIAVSVLAGTVRGLFTLLEATAVSDYWGPAGYASLNGMFSAPLTTDTAIVPLSAQRWRPASADTRHCSSSWPAPAHSAPHWPWRPNRHHGPGISQELISRPRAWPLPAEPGPGRQPRLPLHRCFSLLSAYGDAG
jgi:MFS family permease